MEAGTPTDPENTGRVKKTRRRLRLSCVECTKRRQKCDRKHPCGLCESRNVSHLCRWENVPVARPTPARPPANAGHPPPSASADERSVKALSERISVLERVLEQYTLGRTQADTLSNFASPTPDAGLHSPRYNSPYTDQSSPSQGSSFSSPEPGPLDEKKPIVDTMVLLSPGTRDSILPLVQLSVGHEKEYLGRGSAFGSLRSICQLPWQLQVNESTGLFIADDFIMSLPYSQVIKKIPSPATTTLLFKTYFAHSNWYFGLPEPWLAERFSQMWDSGLHYPAGPAVQLNPYWVSLFFALGAVTPRGYPDLVGSDLESTDHHFNYSMAALQAAENMYENSADSPGLSSLVDGTIFGCLAVPILAKCLAERNRLSDAWKLLGCWIRVAESIGLHRDPAGYEYVTPSEDDIYVRRVAWCNLIIWDRFYSLMLGRSHMGSLQLSDVTMRVSEGPSSQNQVYLSALVGLSTLVAEVNENCLGNVFQNAHVIRDLDASLEQWHGQLAPALRTMHQYGGGFHIRSPELLNQQSSGVSSKSDPLSEQMRLSELSIFTYPISAHGITGDGGASLASSRWSSESLFQLFEATIALVKALWTTPREEQPVNTEHFLQRAYGVFNNLAMHPSGLAGKLPGAALQTLGALLRNLGSPFQLHDISGSPESGNINLPKLDLNLSNMDIPGLASNQEVVVNSNNWSMPDWYSNITPTTQQFTYSPHAGS